MTQQARDLASRFERAKEAVVAVIERGSDGQLQTLCPNERCTAAALACHVAAVHALGADWIAKLVAGEPLPPVTMDAVARINAQQFARDAYRTRRETLERLRGNGAEAAAVLRDLIDADLDRTAPFTLFGGATTSVRELIERILIADPEGHLPSLRAAVAAATPG